MAFYQADPQRYGLNPIASDIASGILELTTGAMARKDPRNIEIRRAWLDPTKHYADIGTGWSANTPSAVSSQFTRIARFNKDTGQYESTHVAKGAQIPEGWVEMQEGFDPLTDPRFSGTPASPGTWSYPVQPPLSNANITQQVIQAGYPYRLPGAAGPINPAVGRMLGIGNEPPLQFATGGRVPDDSIEALRQLIQKDSQQPVPAILHPGEAVLTAEAANMVDTALGGQGIEKLNKSAKVQSFQRGGRVAPPEPVETKKKMLSEKEIAALRKRIASLKSMIDQGAGGSQAQKIYDELLQKLKSVGAEPSPTGTPVAPGNYPPPPPNYPIQTIPTNIPVPTPPPTPPISPVNFPPPPPNTGLPTPYHHIIPQVFGEINGGVQNQPVQQSSRETQPTAQPTPTPVNKQQPKPQVQPARTVSSGYQQPQYTPGTATIPGYQRWDAPGMNAAQFQGMDPMAVLSAIQQDVNRRGVAPQQPVYGGQGQVLPQQSQTEQQMDLQSQMFNQYLSALQGQGLQAEAAGKQAETEFAKQTLPGKIEASQAQAAKAGKELEWYDRVMRASLDETYNKIAYNKALMSQIEAKINTQGGLSIDDMYKLKQLQQLDMEMAQEPIRNIEKSLELSQKQLDAGKGNERMHSLLQLEYAFLKFPWLANLAPQDALTYIKEKVKVPGKWFARKQKLTDEDVIAVSDKINQMYTGGVAAPAGGVDANALLQQAAAEYGE